MENEFTQLEQEVAVKKKGINRAKKGYTKEKEARDFLSGQDWRIVFKSIRYRFGCIDFAQLFDLVAYKGKERKYVSVKHLSGGYYLEHQRDIKMFKEIYGYEGESYELWLWAKPRWTGRGKNKIWEKGGFKIIYI